MSDREEHVQIHIFLPGISSGTTL